MLKPKHHVSQFQLRAPVIASHLRKLWPGGPSCIKFTEMYVEKMEANQGTPPVQTKKDNKEGRAEKQVQDCQATGLHIDCDTSDDRRLRGRAGSRDELCECPNREPRPPEWNEPNGRSVAAGSDVLATIQLQIGGQSPPPLVGSSQIVTAALALF